jgi:hypothetical protein
MTCEKEVGVTSPHTDGLLQLSSLNTIIIAICHRMAQSAGAME